MNGTCPTTPSQTFHSAKSFIGEMPRCRTRRNHPCLGSPLYVNFQIEIDLPLRDFTVFGIGCHKIVTYSFSMPVTGSDSNATTATAAVVENITMKIHKMLDQADQGTRFARVQSMRVLLGRQYTTEVFNWDDCVAAQLSVRLRTNN